jgi:hypothetical protein
MVKRKGVQNVDTPTKCKISRYYQQQGGQKVRGAASATARNFKLGGSNGATRVKKYDAEIRDGVASRKNRLSIGRPSMFTGLLEKEIDDTFENECTLTFREAAKKMGLGLATLHRFATKRMDYRCLSQTVRPFPSEANRQKRMEMAADIVKNDGPFVNEFHQDEKYFICNSRRPKRKKRLSDVAGSTEVSYQHHRRHQTQTMFTGCAGVGPNGDPMRIHFQWISKEKTAKRKSKFHERGDVFRESTTMDAECFKRVLRECGKAIRAEYKKLKKSKVRVKLQIDSAGGHGLARGHGNFEELAIMMMKDFNIELIQQPGNTPMFNILDLTLWQACQLEVDKMNKDLRQREDELVKVVMAAWAALPLIKVLRAFEMRRDCAQEALTTEGWCPQEGKGLNGTVRVRTSDAYAPLRDRLGISESDYAAIILWVLVYIDASRLFFVGL